LRPTGKIESVSPLIGLYFTDKPQTKFPMLVQLEHDGVIDIPPGEKDFVIADDFRASMDLNVLAVYPHAHYLAKLIEGYATLPDGSRKWIVRIPNWDLNWQGVFRLKQPLFLPRGTVVSMRYHYDNSADNVRNPSNPPKRVTGGNEATNEMGHLWLQVLPTLDGDQRAALQDSLVRHRLEKYPADFGANFNMGDLLMLQGNAAGAIPTSDGRKSRVLGNVAATGLGLALFAASERASRNVRQRSRSTPPADARGLASVQWLRPESWRRPAEAGGQAPPQRATSRRVYVMWAQRLTNSHNDEQAALRYRTLSQSDDVEVHIRLGMTSRAWAAE
jgi:hypothetical protein